MKIDEMYGKIRVLIPVKISFSVWVVALVCDTYLQGKCVGLPARFLPTIDPDHSVTSTC